MGLKNRPGLAGGPDIKRGPSHPKPGTRLGRGSLPQCPPTPEEGWVLGRWGHDGLIFSIMPLPHIVPTQAPVGGVLDPLSSPLLCGFSARTCRVQYCVISLKGYT